MMLETGPSRDPETIGRHRVLRALDDSGRHAVYLAEAPNSRRRVAIRVARGAFVRDAVLDAFLRERDVARSLDHPGAVGVIEVDEDPVLGPFLAMSFVDGLSLRESVRRGALAPDAALAVLIDVGCVLDAAHAGGQLHGDLRPSRILVDPGGSARVAAFGALTEDGPIAVGAGWPYLAPERIAGAPPSQEGDRWALATIAVELLTGQPPPDPGTLPPGLDPGLQAVFERALAREPSLRHPSVRSFLEDLVVSSPLGETERSTLLAGLPGGPAGIGTDPASRRQRRVVALAVFGIVSALMLRAGGDWLLTQVPSPPGLRLLEVSSSPPGAEVLVDGVPVGETPRRMYAPENAERIHVAKEGYQPVDRVLDRTDRAIDLSLEPSTPIRIAYAPRRPAPAPERRVEKDAAALAPAPPPETLAEPEPEATGLLPLLAEWLRDERR